MRHVSWIRAAFKDFKAFPLEVQTRMALALESIAHGDFPDISKPLVGFESGLFELALPWRGDAWRVVYALKIDDDVWVIHVFQKKSKQGIKTPRQDIELIRNRVKLLRSLT
jgi:phage-related protein